MPGSWTYEVVLQRLRYDGCFSPRRTGHSDGDALTGFLFFSDGGNCCCGVYLLAVGG
ncbi:hypothetical protein RchiOBHm_Chr2g0122241 [Rosa chinensis]|uniref:Uncharacterized protein n=1 Tax=Rosa chinensis TaxID=74649 RepID=A0A2P6RSS9_ROSCH|nr:hypothetical protein RchiOBHm_Chr2g0122241 [Rosa chinensis]